MIESLYPCFQYWSKTGSVYLVSDTHFDDLDREYMGYTISSEEQFALLKNTCHKNDTLIHLGDVGNLDYIKRLNCYKVLIMGNHDQGKSNFKKTDTMIDLSKYTEPEIRQMERRREIDYWSYDFHHLFIKGYKSNNLFDEVYSGPLWISDKIVLSHEPINVEDCLTFQPIAFNIHGHDHSGLYRPYHLNIVPNKKGYAPWDLSTIIKHGFLKDIKNIHKITIDTATEEKQYRENIARTWYEDTGVENV